MRFRRKTTKTCWTLVEIEDGRHGFSPVEVGCRGFPSQSVWKILGAVGIKGGARKLQHMLLARLQRERPVGSG
jgi:hypothetical protein